MEWVPMVGVLAMVALIVLSYSPIEASLGAYAFLLPFDSVLILGSAGRIHLHATWFFGIATVCALMAAGLLNRGFLRPPRVALWLSLLVFWAGISVWWAIDTGSASLRLPVMGLLLVLYLTASSLPVTEKELTSVAWLSILGGCVAAALSLYQLHEGRYYLPEDKGYEYLIDETSRRASLWLGTTATNPNTLAASLILPLSLALGMLLSAGSWLLRLGITALLLLISSCIYVTGSRGALMASAAVLLVYLVRCRARWGLLLPIAILGGAVAAVPQFFQSRLSQGLEDQGGGRLEIWRTGLETSKHYALLGAGLDCFPAASSKYAERYSAEHFHGAERAPHNTYLGTGVELGAVGLALLITFIATQLKAVAKASRSSSGSSHLQLASYEAACWGLLVAGLFADLLWEQYLWLILILLAMGLRARKATGAVRYVPARAMRSRPGIA